MNRRKFLKLVGGVAAGAAALPLVGRISDEDAEDMRDAREVRNEIATEGTVPWEDVKAALENITITVGWPADTTSISESNETLTYWWAGDDLTIDPDTVTVVAT